MIPERSVVCMPFRSLPVDKSASLSFPFDQWWVPLQRWQKLGSSTSVEMMSQKGFVHVVKMCCLGWDSQLDLRCIANGEQESRGLQGCLGDFVNDKCHNWWLGAPSSGESADECLESSGFTRERIWVCSCLQVLAMPVQWNPDMPALMGDRADEKDWPKTISLFLLGMGWE